MPSSIKYARQGNTFDIASNIRCSTMSLSVRQAHEVLVAAALPDLCMHVQNQIVLHRAIGKCQLRYKANL